MRKDSVRTKKPALTQAEGMGRPTPAGGKGRPKSTCDSKLVWRPPAESVPPIPVAISVLFGPIVERISAFK